MVIAARQTPWRPVQIGEFLLLLGCGLVSGASTPRVVYSHSGLARDFLVLWVLPVAILLPPIYAMLTPIPLLFVTQLYIHRGVVHRRVFSAGAIGLCYGIGSYVFRMFPATFAGARVGAGLHALTWILAVLVCEVIGWLGHHTLIVLAVKLTSPSAKISELEFNRAALNADFAQLDLGILITVAVGVNPVLALFGLPTVLLVRRFLVHEVLVAEARIDAKTGLLNVSTWEREAETEVSRALRTRSPLAILLVDIDHFKTVNDTHGHLVGDRVLRAVTDGLTSQLRDYDRAGRFGGEEFVVLLPQTSQRDAHSIADRLRGHIAAMAVPVNDKDNAATVSLTISVGVAGMDGMSGELEDLLSAADAALYYAKQAGRNRTHVFTAGSEPVEMPIASTRLDGHTARQNEPARVPWAGGPSRRGELPTDATTVKVSQNKMP
jgi:diguanylate cyclase (GGDEF)-like protein